MLSRASQGRVLASVARATPQAPRTAARRSDAGSEAASVSPSYTKASFSTSRSSHLFPLTHLSHSPVFLDKVASPDSSGVIPAFRLLDGQGHVLPEVPEEWKKQLEEVPEETWVKLYKSMMFLPALDTILASSQRQGRISFYSQLGAMVIQVNIKPLSRTYVVLAVTSYGEEGAVVGSAAAWSPTDEVFAQYREVGVLVWRDYPLSDLMAQVFSTVSDKASKGRQMPVHYGSPTHHFHTISSPLGTQIPQAAGAAYSLKLSPERKGDCVICYMGEGATSEGDFHAGFNMASVLGGPVVFFVRNNGFAISTPAAQQYKGDGIAARGPGYGIETVRVDGNDPLAVYLASKEARRRAVEGQNPVLVEAMSYRVGHHSTSDDSSAYRSTDDVSSIKKLDSPLFRLRSYLETRNLWSSELEEATKVEQRKSILRAYAGADKEKKPAWEEMFGGVYGDREDGGLERHLKEQKMEVKRLIGKWGQSDMWKKDLERHDGGIEAVKKW
ncbi:BZ3500_MvSof-1268-A1-R1_Chr1-2g01382 [Microbotryum saponariae]|uniref:2-oxoisovalerate dehydrogenase subunit alpha n=1 Tax=Microbotryum saponariae TaxID=289078 RepID=A0A2X0KTM6_9BASI|nr:BZ3500_MvSof-1268-A1-R1_Chr1-2g01382 [Microbotryum saponariae]SCZ97262.1 BZ3501_MvSof-1269-A2-R1_Chr1-2g00981 [Microbotryum saponariae]